MSDSLKFIVYSDIHYDRLGAGCITFDDCAKIETAICNRAVELECDFVLFCGDRFLKREPEDEIKTKADRVIYDAYRAFKDNGKFTPHYNLIGNHDWTKKSLSWHTSNSLVWNESMIIMDKPMT